MTRIIIADDHDLVRAGLKKLLQGEKGMKVVGEASNGTEVMELLRKRSCDILIIDISMPGRSGLDLLADIRKEHRSVPVLVLTIHPEERFAIRAFRGGAAGYVTKGRAAADIVGAIKKIVAGKKYVSEELAERFASGLDSEDKLPHEYLTTREFQIMCMLASNKNAKEIGRELSISKGTVYSYRVRIMKKMRMRTNVELSHYALGHRLID